MEADTLPEEADNFGQCTTVPGVDWVPKIIHGPTPLPNKVNTLALSNHNPNNAPDAEKDMECVNHVTDILVTGGISSSLHNVGHIQYEQSGVSYVTQPGTTKSVVIDNREQLVKDTSAGAITADFSAKNMEKSQGA